jgi:Na+/melibiose symporter-like transporter
VRDLLSHRDARLLVAGQTLSLLGDRAMFLALGIWVKSLTGSSAAAGLVFFAFAVPGIAAPAAGLVVDRVRRRRLMIATDLVIAAVVSSLLLVHGRDQVWLIYVVTVLYGGSAVVFGSAQSALVAEMLPERLLPAANAALQTASEGMRLIAPLGGAALFAWLGGGAVAVLDAGTFLVSAACLAGLRHHDVRPEPHELRLREQVAAGARHIARTVPLRRIVLALAVALLVVGFAETLIFTVIDRGLHRPPSFLGVLSGCQGIGAIAGAVVAPAAMRRLGDGRLVAGGLALFAVGDGLLIVPRLPAAIVGIVIAGVGVSWAVVGFGSAVQLRTPQDLQGRVYSAAELVVGLPQTLSIAAGAALSTVVDYRLLLAAMAAVATACGAYLAVRGEPAPAAHYAPPDAELAGSLGAGPGGGARP